MLELTSFAQLQVILSRIFDWLTPLFQAGWNSLHDFVPFFPFWVSRTSPGSNTIEHKMSSWCPHYGFRYRSWTLSMSLILWWFLFLSWMCTDCICPNQIDGWDMCFFCEMVSIALKKVYNLTTLKSNHEQRACLGQADMIEVQGWKCLGNVSA